MSAHATTTHHQMSDIAAMQREIKNIKTHFAPTSEMIKWTVGVGVATVLSLTGIVSGMSVNTNARIADMEQDIREIRKESTIEHKEIRKEIAELSSKINDVSSKIDTLITHQRK
jgi:uncharacterized membrane protein YgaE (UPF0421/DUF939 family)